MMDKQMDNVNHIERHVGTQDNPLELIHAVMHQYRSQQYQVLRDGPHDLTHMETKALGFFARHPGATQSALAQDSGRDKAQLARLVKGLRERGLLDAQADEADRRNVRLTPTAQGRAVLDALHEASGHLAAQAVAGMSPEEQQQLAALLQRVRENLAVSKNGAARG
jgi:DNA-binding MarR family transcriptional regulator